MSFRIRTHDVTARIAEELRSQAETAADGNTLISKAEQGQLDEGPLREAIDQVRAEEGKGARVTIDEAVERAMRTAAEKIAGVNQPSGQGATYVSKAEIEALSAQDPAWGALAGNAYAVLADQARAASGVGDDPPPPAVDLPPGAADDLAERLYEGGVIEQPDGFAVSNAQAGDDGSFSFSWSGEGGAGEAWMKQIEGEWFFSPVALSDGQLHQATLGMRAYFDEYFSDWMSGWPASPNEIQAARDAIAPLRVLFPGEEDPAGLGGEYPLVFEMRNHSGSDHGFFLGFDPATGDSRGEAFN